MFKARSIEGKVRLNPEDLFRPKGVKEISVEYYLVESVDEEPCEPDKKKIYGVEVVKNEIYEDNKVITEKEVLSCISYSREKAKKIIDKLVINTVTPVGLIPVVDNLMAAAE